MLIGFDIYEQLSKATGSRLTDNYQCPLQISILSRYRQHFLIVKISNDIEYILIVKTQYISKKQRIS